MNATLNGPENGSDANAIQPTTMVGGNERADSLGREISDQLDLRKLIADLVRNKWLILGIIVASVSISAILTALSEPQFMATTTVEIDPQTARVLDVEDVQAEETARDPTNFLQTQVQILNSRSLAEAVAEDLGLLQNDSFLETMGGAIPSSDLSAAAQLTQRRNAVVAVLASNLSISLLPQSQIVEIRFSSPSGGLSAKVANSYAENYIRESLARRFDVGSYARDFISGQLAEAKKRLEDSERNLITYSRAAGLIDVSGSGGGQNSTDGTGQPVTLTASTLSQTNTALTAATADRIAAEERWKRAQNAPSFSLPNVYQNSAVSQLLQQRATLDGKYQEGLQRYKEDYPQMQQLAAERRQIDQALNSITSNIRLSLKEDYLAAQGRENALLRVRDELTSQQLNEQDRGVQFGFLSREVRTNRTIYDGLLQRFKELSAAAGLTGNNISIIDRAVVPTMPFSPRPTINLLLGLFVGLILAILFVFAKERLFGRVRTPEDLQKFISYPVLSSIPFVEKGELATELADTKSPVSEAYHVLKSALRLSTAHGNPRSISVTSGQGSEGKSTTSFKIASEFATSGKKVLLVDCDLRRPSVHTLVGVANVKGLSDLLTGQEEFANVAHQSSQYENLNVVTAGARPPNPPELLSSETFQQFIKNAMNSYDLVVLDSPPILGFADAHLIASLTEASIYVVQSGLWSGPQVARMLRRFLSFRSNLAGVVLTKFDAQTSGYYDYYEYSYGY